MNVVLNGVGSRVAGGKPPGPAWDEPWTSVGGYPATPNNQTLHGLLSTGSQVGGMPIGGMWRASVGTHQLPDSLRERPHAGHDINSGGR